ncbi:hypothetical protein D3C78_1324590 [compost metagenome]
MQRLTVFSQLVSMQCDQNALGSGQRLLRQQAVTARHLFFTDVTTDIQCDTLPGLRLLNRLVLRVQASYPHRGIGTGQPQLITHGDLPTQCGTGHHQTRAFNAERAIHRQTEATG